MLSAETGAVRVPDDWFDGFHHGLVARFWRAAGAAMLEDDWRRLSGLLGPGDGRSVLDVPCGDGRLTHRLAAAGFARSGSTSRPRRSSGARRAAGPARFLVGDLRALPDVGPVRRRGQLGQQLRLPPAGRDGPVAGRLHGVLRPGGRLLLESLTVAESLLVSGIEPHAEHEAGGVRMTAVNHYRVEESRLESDAVFEDGDGVVERAQFAHHVHTAGEVVRMLRGAGFAAVEFLGADGESPYELGSPRLIAVATA